MPVEVAQKYAEGIRVAIMAGKDFEGEKKKGFFLSKKRGFEDKLYVGNIRRIENHLYWNDEELAEDDQIVNVIVMDGPVTRDGDGCSYGSKDHRDQILYANTIPQVVGHIFILNTPGGAASARVDYEQAIADCREKGKSTVAWVDGMCCSAGQLVASLCDRTVVMNGRHTMGCIGTMCAFWGVANNTVDQDGYRYIELVSVTSPDKNAEFREACDGKTEKLQAELDKLGEEFRMTVRQNRPLVKEEHLTGKTFYADEVMGELVDEIGDYARAIDCVFELADKKLTPAREATVIPDEPKEDPEEGGDGQKDIATLNEQQKAAIAASPGETMIVDDGHVKKSVPSMFGPQEQEIATPNNKNNMPENETMAQEAVAAETPKTTEAPAQEEQAPQEEQPATEENPAEKEAPAAEEKPAEEAPATEEQTAEEEVPSAEEAPATEEQPAEEESPADAQEGLAKVTDALHTAEALVNQRDKEIAEKQKELDTISADLARANDEIQKKSEDLKTAFKNLDERDKEIAELKSANEKLTKQVSELRAEVKELSEKPTPMVTADNGLPADNGTGQAPAVSPHQKFRRGMSYEEYRAAAKG